MARPTLITVVLRAVVIAGMAYLCWNRVMLVRSGAYVAPWELALIFGILIALLVQTALWFRRQPL